MRRPGYLAWTWAKYARARFWQSTSGTPHLSGGRAPDGVGLGCGPGGCSAADRTRTVTKARTPEMTPSRTAAAYAAAGAPAPLIRAGRTRATRRIAPPAAHAAPNQNGAPGEIASQSTPAMIEAGRSRMPTTALRMP